MRDTSAHSAKTDSGRRSTGFKILQDSFGNSFAIVPECHHDGAGLYRDNHFGPVGAGMAVNIGETLLQDTEES